MKNYREDYLAHHGVKGQKWGVRRFQNKDGSLTSQGKRDIRPIRKKTREELDKEAEKNGMML